MAIKIIVDSASDISLKEANEMGIEMLPMQITFGEELYYDGVDLLPYEFYEKLIESDELPKTSQITPFRFEEKIEELVNQGHEVIVITISSKLSATYNNAYMSCRNFEGKAFAVDSLSATIGERLLVLHALNLIEEGKTVQEIVDELNEVKHRIAIIALVDTLEYLKRGGRVSPAVAFAGELLSIKPVIGVVNGEIKVIGKARGSKKGNNLLNELINERGIDHTLPYGAVFSGLSDANLRKYIHDSAPLYIEYIPSVPRYPIGSTIGTHVGPGALGVAFFTNK